MKLAELKNLLLQADSAVVVVPPRVLRNIIQREYHVPYLLIEVPHEKCHVFDRQIVLREVEQDKLELAPDRRLPDSVIMMARPSPEELEGDPSALLLRYWRFLFHAKVDQSLMQQAAAGQFTTEHLRNRIEAIGQTEFEEIREVLTQENFLPDPDDDLRVYIEFAALYLDLRYFASNLRQSYFPSLRSFAAIDAILAQDVEAETLFRQTRLAGAPDPVVRTDTSSDESNDYYYRLLAQADNFAARGDSVRAAILRTKAARVAPAALTERTRRLAHGDLERLTQRLRDALGLDDAQMREWLEVLPSLLEKADQGRWPVEARLLYDLQNVCAEFEKKIFTLDLVEWVISAGHRPVQRPLHSLQLVRMTKHLRSADQRLTMARVSVEDRQLLGRLLQSAQARGEQQLRERFRPILTDALHDVGLSPRNNPEKVAQKKLVEELLDRLTTYGFLTFSEVRDTLARNQLKMNDLADPHDFLRGDALLRLDRRLNTAMDGVYRRGEFYLRMLERLSSLLFGTDAGRFVTRNLIIPFGGALIIMAMLDMLIIQPLNPGWTIYPEWSGAALGVVFLALTHSAPLRRGLQLSGQVAYRSLRFVLYEGPRRFYRLPLVQQVLKSWTWLLFSWYLLKPLAVSALVWWAYPATWEQPAYAVLVFVVALAALHSKYGALLSEAFGELFALVYGWLRFDLLQGLVRWTLYIFKRISDAFEYVLYTVDEWLRFSSAASRWQLAVRSVLGLIWFPIGYVIRLYFVTMIEPSLNPLKLPLSSLAAKFMFPLYLGLLTPFSEAQKGVIDRIDGAVGYGLAVGIMFVVIWPTLWLLPSVFSFFVWEMKGNWRAFRANRPKNLEPVMIGDHGETLPRLLRPGFHSGTVPKLYASLRRAERQAYRTGEWRAARDCRQRLSQVSHSVQVFVEREFITLLREQKGWQDAPLAVGPIHLAGNRISVSVLHGQHPDRPMRIAFDERAGWLLAGMLACGWLDEVDAAQRTQVVLALAGLYKLAGADLVREQIRALLQPREPAYDVTPAGLTLWPHARGGERLVYDLSSFRAELRPKGAHAQLLADWPVLPARRLRFDQQPIPWDDWVAAWEPAGARPLPDSELLRAWRFYVPPASVEAPAAPAMERNGAANGRHLGEANGHAVADGMVRRG